MYSTLYSIPSQHELKVSSRARRTHFAFFATTYFPCSSLFNNPPIPTVSPTLQLFSTSMRLGLLSPIQGHLQALQCFTVRRPSSQTFTMASDPTAFDSGVGSSRQHPDCVFLKMAAEIMMKICVGIMRDWHAPVGPSTGSRLSCSMATFAASSVAYPLSSICSARYTLINEEPRQLVESPSFLTVRV
jgi:hypothetical protein